VFWSQALLAEVYTLNAALFAGVLLFLLRWAQSRRDRDLIAAIALVAAGAAHHLTLVMTIPALTAYALAVDRRRALSPRVVAWALLLAAASVAAYGYIWLRTAQHAPFLEVQAHRATDLLAIMRADAFDQFLGKLSIADILHERVPLIVGWLSGELRTPGILLAGVGVVAIAGRRAKHAIVLGGAAATIVAFALDYVVYDVEVFLLIPMIVLGLVAGVGLEAAASRVNLYTASRWLRAAAALAMFAFVVYGQFDANRIVNDQHRHVYEDALLDALFRTLPDRSAIVRESYPIDHMLLYKMLAEHAHGSRDIVLIPPAPAAVRAYKEAGYRIFAFHEHRMDLEAAGVRFVDAHLPLPTARSLTHILDTECLTMGYPVGEVSGVGAPPNHVFDPPPFNAAIRAHRW
jgi:Protein of unknown function (DUF2723)